MSKFASEFLNTLSARDFIHQCSDYENLDALAAKRQGIAYIGFDCTAPSLHIGSLVQIMLLYWAQQTGQKPIVLMGGGTTRVGDPSGRDDSRRLLSLEEIEANKRGIEAVFAKFLSFGAGRGDALMADNSEWLTKLNYIDMLREIGRHFSVNRMLTMESVKLRLEREHELSFIEFNYMVLQAYDFVELARRYGCNLQMGGSDQWGNIVTGIDLGRRMGTHQLYALTTPLITTASGAKMGKTASGAVWLNADMCSPYEYWQFWRNTEDADVGRFLRLFTTLPLAEIERLDVLKGAEINEAKKVLANEATAMAHGAEATREAADTARKTFEEGSTGASLPTREVDLSEGGRWRLQRSNTAIVAASGLVTSNRDARRKIIEGGIRIDDITVVDPDAMQPLGKSYKVQLGKKNIVIVRDTSEAGTGS
jgi:tyrosyl-tRNA synthetase